MDKKESRKESNKKYYQTNKDEIAKKLYTKEVCMHCGRSVSHQTMPKHLKTSYCISRKQNKQDEDILTAVKNNSALYDAIIQEILS
jgi:hypothetical protein